MAYFRQLKSGSWRAEVARVVRGKQVYLSETFATRAAAEGWARQTEIEVLDGTRGIKSKRTLRELLARYRVDCLPLLRSQGPPSYTLGRIERDMPGIDTVLDDVDVAALERWRSLRSQGYMSDGQKHAAVASSTVNREFNILSAAFEHGIKLGWCRHNPVRSLDRAANPPPRKQRVSDEVVGRVVAALDYQRGSVPTKPQHRVALAFLLSLETMMRRGEITGLVAEHIHPKHVYLPLTKNGDPREVPLRPPARELLALAVAGKADRPFFVHHTHFDHLWRGAVLAAGVPHLQFRDARREAASRLSKIYSVMELAKIGGWRDIKTLFETYYRPTVDELADR